MLKFDSLGFLGGCAMLNPNGDMEADTGKGILQNHAYGIMDVVEVDNHKLIRIRNPWGQVGKSFITWSM